MRWSLRSDGIEAVDGLISREEVFHDSTALAG